MRALLCFEAAETHAPVALHVPLPWRASLKTCWVQTRAVCARRQQSRQDT